AAFFRSGLVLGRLGIGKFIQAPPAHRMVMAAGGGLAATGMGGDAKQLLAGCHLPLANRAILVDEFAVLFLGRPFQRWLLAVASRRKDELAVRRKTDTTDRTDMPDESPDQLAGSQVP